MKLNTKHSEATKKKMSESLKGKIPWMKGKKHTEESLHKMSNSHLQPIVVCKIQGCTNFATAVSCICLKHRFQANNATYSKRHPEKKNAYYKKNKEMIKTKRAKNRDEINVRQRKWRKDLKIEVFSHYSKGKPQCSICGFDDIRALCLDHINDDGAEQRRKIRPNNKQRGGNAIDVYIRAKREKYPNDLQVLCSNCNRIKEHSRINA